MIFIILSTNSVSLGSSPSMMIDEGTILLKEVGLLLEKYRDTVSKSFKIQEILYL